MGLRLPIAPNLQTALNNAGALAKSLNKQIIATEHLLYGLASTPNSVAYRILQKYRVDDKISYDKEFLLQDPDGYLLRFNN